MLSGAIQPKLPKQLCRLVAEFAAATTFVKVKRCGRFQFYRSDLKFTKTKARFVIQESRDPTRRIHLLRSIVIRHMRFGIGKDFRLDIYFSKMTRLNLGIYYFIKVGIDPRYPSDDYYLRPGNQLDLSLLETYLIFPESFPSRLS